MDKKKKVLITGGKGFLGSRLEAYYKSSYDVLCLEHGALDITDREAVITFFKKAEPDIVLHCGAISDTGLCEREHGLSFDVNVKGSLNIGAACRLLGCLMVMMSSDQIYNGSHTRTPGNETEGEPVGVYGKHKLQAETELLKLLPEAVCLRLTWMYDFPVRGLKTNRNILSVIGGALRGDIAIRMPVNEFRGLTDVHQVVVQMEKAWELPGGVYNFGSFNGESTYDTAVWLISIMASGKEHLILKDEERYADVPRNLVMCQDKIRSHGILFSDTREGLIHCLGEYGLLF